MDGLPAGASGASRRLYELAYEIADKCPDAVSREIALTGSAARGLADGYSDIELNVWVERMPADADWQQWLQHAGAEEVQPHLAPIDVDGWAWLVFRYQGVWVEMGFAEIAQQEGLYGQILAGELVDHTHLTIASIVARAVPLRTEGWLIEQRARLERYPDGLAGKIIAANTAAWSDPHQPSVRHALVQRADRMALALRLIWDMQNLLRILYAVNRRWDEDWKWTEEEAERLPIKPDHVGARLARVFELSQPHDSVETAFRLILDTLDLVPPQYDVSRARANIKAALDARPAV